MKNVSDHPSGGWKANFATTVSLHGVIPTLVLVTAGPGGAVVMPGTGT